MHVFCTGKEILNQLRQPILGYKRIISFRVLLICKVQCMSQVKPYSSLVSQSPFALLVKIVSNDL